jgi:uncharacterized protein
VKETVMHERVSIPVGEKNRTSGVLVMPAAGQKRTAVIVAHGAGNDMETPLIVAFCEGLAGAGYPALRFNFLYTEQGRKAPDSPENLAKTWGSAYRFARDRMGGDIESWAAAGKSMGGRIASRMVADGLLPVDRLVFLGYPLHPAGDKEKLRDGHLYGIKVPMLFFAGTRDQLCDMNLLRGVLARLQAPWDLYTIDGGDHSFHVPRAAGLKDAEIQDTIIAKTVEWLGSKPKRTA